jgi:hypothetical protein
MYSSLSSSNRASGNFASSDPTYNVLQLPAAALSRAGYSNTGLVGGGYVQPPLQPDDDEYEMMDGIPPPQAEYVVPDQQSNNGNAYAMATLSLATEGPSYMAMG